MSTTPSQTADGDDRPQRADQTTSRGADHDPRRQDDLTLAGLLMEASNGLLGALQCIHQRFGLIGREFDALMRLDRSADRTMRMSDLAAQTMTSTSGVTSLVDRLEGRGLVRRAVGSTDRRSVQVQLTDAGRAVLLADIDVALQVIRSLVIEPLGGGRDTFEELIRRVRDAACPTATRTSAPIAADCDDLDSRPE